MTTLALLLQSDLGALLPERARELAMSIIGSPEVGPRPTPHPSTATEPHDHEQPPPLPPLPA